eukprot:TRINITY_DN23073_c0_g1_i1.p3 TRINITY_DN23073_c0_g1~~TRINITY_DN23073_c0_g1_i1.p3  ORF type:complete len:111 (-),score=21.25 TRINITY_DN23073_c0_g1_i1:213-545(-)
MSSAEKRPVDGAMVSSLVANAAWKATLGSLVFIPAMVLFKGRGMRCLCGGMGIGFGAGAAWTHADLFIRYPGAVPAPETMTEKILRLPDPVQPAARQIRDLLDMSKWFGK